MKNILFLFSILLSTTIVAQEIEVNDALRYANDNSTGTARFRAMGGAFGAVGGDLSSININPAGSLFNNYNVFAISITNKNTNNKSEYFGSTAKENENSLDINQIGAIFIFKDTNDEENHWDKFSLGLNYENTNNLDNEIFINGTNPLNSVSNYFLQKAQGIPLSVLTGFGYNQLYFNEQQAFLGYDTYLFEPFDANNLNNDSYYTNVSTEGNYYQENYTKERGYNGKLTGNIATAYKNKLFLGLNLNAHFTDYTKNMTIYESNNNDLYATGSTITELQFDNQIYTFGAGFSFNLGAIYKWNDNFRFGLAYESPTWIRLTDQLTQRLATRSINNPDNNTLPVSSQNTIEYEPYTVKTPSKWTSSLAYIFENGLLSFDLSSKDYSTTRFKPKNEEVYSVLNAQMKDGFKNAISYAIGGEYKIKKLSLRAGYRLEDSPYQNESYFGDMKSVSGGLGYLFGDSRVDLSYANSKRTYQTSLISSGMNDTAKINAKNDVITISYTMIF